MEKIGKLDKYNSFNKMPILRKNNRIHSIHFSLAIEANSLSLNQVNDVINGNYVIGEQKEIYGIMTYLTLKDSGNFRKGPEGVFDGEVCIFMAPSEKMVPELMENLFKCIYEQKDKIHPLILSSIFHYEFLFIHPFADGNGRMARLWQNVMLSKWKNIFKYVPIETQIKKYQEDYYKTISICHVNGNFNAFIEFMLKMIDETLNELIKTSLKYQSNISIYVKKLVDVMDTDLPLSATEIMERLNLKSKETFRKNYIDPAIEIGLIKLTIPDKPTSKNQRYYKV